MIPYEIYDQIQIGWLTFYTWGLLLALSFVLGLFLFLSAAKKKNQDLASMFYLFLGVMLGSLIGAKIGFLLQYPEKLWQLSNYFNSQGYMLYGGLLGGLLVGWTYVKIAKLNFWLLADLAVLPVCLGIFLTRLGCFCLKDHPGAITQLPWAVLWPDGSLRHPVAFYLSLNGLLMLVIFLLLKRKSRMTGQLWLWFLLYYSASRFCLDFCRARQAHLSDPRWLALTTSQWISIFIFFIALVSYYFLRWKINARKKTRQS